MPIYSISPRTCKNCESSEDTILVDNNGSGMVDNNGSGMRHTIDA